MEVADSIPHIEPWFDVGLYLGVKMPHLEDLKGLPSGQMSRIMRGWLGGDRHMFDYLFEPRWKKLVKAIAHPAGGNNVALAEEIALSHLAPADVRFIGMFNFILYTKLTSVNGKYTTYRRSHEIMWTHYCSTLHTCTSFTLGSCV